MFTRTGLLSSPDQPYMFARVLAAACKRNLPVMPQKTHSEKPEKRLNLPLCRKGLLDALNQRVTCLSRRKTLWETYGHKIKNDMCCKIVVLN